MITHRYSSNNVRWLIPTAIALLCSLSVNTAGANLGDLLYTLAPPDALVNDGFGSSIAISGNAALIGAPASYNYPPPRNGSAYLFDLTTRRMLTKLTPSDASSRDRFGFSVAVDGNLALIGAPRDANHGVAYLFDLDTGQQLAEFSASDAYAEDFFGSSVALSGNHAIVGACRAGSAQPCSIYGSSNQFGAAYIFDLATRQQVFKLTASDAEPHDNFGSSVAISGDKLIVGAWENDHIGSHGSAYGFDVNTGQQLHKLTAPPLPDDNFDGNFGYSVALNRNFALIGANYGIDDDTYDYTGSAYLFDATTGQPLVKLKHSDAHQYDGFGQSVAISNSIALVGAVGDHNPEGKAYLFDLGTGQELLELLNDKCCGDGFGYSVALGPDTAIIGAPYYGDYGEGRVYVFSTVPEPVTWWLAGFGFAAVSLLVRRRHRSDS
jgi:outer membrane protein assembly factor BamB